MKKIYTLIIVTVFCFSNMYGQQSRIWATYYGNTGNDGGYMNSVATDASGNVYLCSSTTSASGIASGGHQNTFGGGIDAFLVKFDASGNRLWATYYGGTGSDYGRAVVTDASGNVYLGGETQSTTNIASGGHQNTHGGGSEDAFLVKFNSAGVRQWATYYGGAGSDFGYDLGVDGIGNILIGGSTNSTTAIASGGHQNTFGGTIDAFLVKFNSSGVRQWATYYGGSMNEQGYAMSVDATTNEVYLSGLTESTSSIASGGFQNTYAGGTDAFLVKFNSLGTRQWGTYYGDVGSEFGDVYGLTTDGLGNVFLSGGTNSTSGMASGGFQNTYGGGTGDAFLVKFNSSGSRMWATYYGGLGVENFSSCDASSSGDVYLGGRTTSTTSIASGGFQNTIGGGDDGYLVKFDGNGNRLLSTYYGDVGVERIYNVVFDPTNNVYAVGQTSSTVNIASGGFQNAFGGGSNDAFLVKFDSQCLAPSQPGTISGSVTVCNGATNTYSITAVAGATSYTWTLPSGWTGTSTTNSINATASSTSGNITVTANNTCGNSTPQTLAVSVNTVPPVPGAITGNTIICAGSTNTYSISPVAGAISYTWTFPSGWTGTSTTNSITGTASAIGGNVIVTAENACGSSLPQTTAISIITIPATPGTISGTATICSGTTNTYSITAVAGATSYTWTLPGGWTGTSTTNSINATASATSGNITVTANNTCGSSSVQTKAIVVNTIPTTPGTISGSATICSGTTNTYSITAVAGATSYTWTLPGGWTGTSTTNSINATASATSGNITVTANNTCGNSSAQTLAVTVNSIPATPGTISGTTTICSGTTNTYSITAVAGATSYTWTLPSGWTGTSTTNSINATASATSGNITVTANNICGNSTAATLAIVVNTAPATPGTISGLASMCVGTGVQTYSITAIGGATSYTWTLPATWSGTSTTNSIVATPGTSGGNITVTANNICGNSSAQTLAVVVNPLPTVTYSQSPSLVCVNITSFALGTVSPTGGTFTGTAVTGSTFNATTAGVGTYTITYTYTDVNSCVNTDTSSITVNPCTGIVQNSIDNEIVIFPNPTSGIVSLTGIEKESTVEVFNVLGEKVLSVQCQNTSVDLNLSELENGIYFAKVSSETNTVTKKIIKN